MLISVCATIDCPHPLDLVFLVDDSSSIREEDWPSVQQFLVSVTSSFTIGRDETRIGIVRYSSLADIIYRLTSTQTVSSIVGAINRMQHLGGSTNLAMAMVTAYRDLFIPAVRPEAAKV